MRIPDTLAAAACAAALFMCTGTANAAPAKASPAPGASPASDAPTPYATFVTGAKVQDGIFPVVTKNGKVYLALAKNQLDTDFYEHATTANGLGGFGLLSGDDFDQPARIVRFERIDDKHVAFIFPPERFQGRPGSPVANAVAASTANSVQAVAPIIAEDTDSGKVVVDTAFLLGDQLDLANRLSDIVQDPDHPSARDGYHLDSTRTYFGPSKTFPRTSSSKPTRPLRRPKRPTSPSAAIPVRSTPSPIRAASKCASSITLRRFSRHPITCRASLTIASGTGSTNSSTSTATIGSTMAPVRRALEHESIRSDQTFPGGQTDRLHANEHNST